MLGGSIARLADGRYDVRFRLSDAVRQTSLGGESLVAAEADLRFAAHRIADWVYEKLTGENGIFSTRIAFVSKQGPRYRLNIADWDGENIQTPLASPEPIISPSWSPDGGRLAYVSFESKKPVVYVHTLATGQRQAVANFKGSNSAPAWSPDGRNAGGRADPRRPVAGLPDQRDGSGPPRRLTQSSGIDTEPVFAPDGKTLYFTSDRGGSPQIYRMSIDGGDTARVTFGSGYNVSPRVSPDGRHLAFVTRRDGRFVVAMKELGRRRRTGDVGWRPRGIAELRAERPLDHVRDADRRPRLADGDLGRRSRQATPHLARPATSASRRGGRLAK